MFVYTPLSPLPPLFLNPNSEVGLLLHPPPPGLMERSLQQFERND